MIASHVLPLELQIPSLVVLGLFLAWVLRLIRTHRLSVRESLVWLLSTLAAMVVTAFPSILVRAAHLVGIQVPANAIFGAGLLYLALNVLAITISTSANTAHVRRLAQECALLRAEVQELRAGLAEPVGHRRHLEPALALRERRTVPADPSAPRDEKHPGDDHDRPERPE